MGSFWGLLGVSWGLSGAPRSTKRGLQLRLGTPLGLVCSLLVAEDGRESLWGPSLARFWCSPGPLWVCFRLRLIALNPQNCPSEFNTSFLFVAVVVALVAVVAVAAAVVVFDYSSASFLFLLLLLLLVPDAE